MNEEQLQKNIIRNLANNFDLNDNLISLAHLVVMSLEVLKKENFDINFFNEHRKQFRCLDEMLDR